MSFLYDCWKVVAHVPSEHHISVVKQYVNESDKIFGFMIRNNLYLPNNLSGNTSEFWTSESQEIAKRPKLTIITDETAIVKDTQSSSQKYTISHELKKNRIHLRLLSQS